MSSNAERIPVPPSQRWELVRERLIPAAALVMTAVACGWLWRQQMFVAPTALGQVHSDAVEIASPCNGELLPLEATDGGRWAMFAKIDADAVVARVKDRDAGDQIVEMRSPLAGMIVAAPALPRQSVRQGDVLVVVASPRPDYIMCHVTSQGQAPPAVGAGVLVRSRGGRSAWHRSVVDAVGPAIEPAPPSYAGEALTPTRGLPVQIALPKDVELLPGSVVEVRFLPASREI